MVGVEILSIWIITTNIAPGGSKASAETPTNPCAQLLLRVQSVHLGCIFSAKTSVSSKVWMVIGVTTG